MYIHELETTVSLPDEDEVDVTVEFVVTYWGAPGVGPSLEHSGREAEPPDFFIKSVTRTINGEDVTALIDEKDFYEAIFECIEDNR